MNRTKLLYRLGLAGSALALLTAAALGFVPDATVWQISMVALGGVGALLTSHLRMRQYLAAQRKSTSALHGLMTRNADRDAVAESLSELSTAIQQTDADLLLGTGDVQASIAASESFLLAEVATLRQRIASSGSQIVNHIDAMNRRHTWTQGQFQQLRTQLEHLPSDTGEYSALRRLLIPDHSPMPQLGGWAISSATVDSVVHQTLAEDGPRTIVELGSGASTLWLASALRKRGTGGHIHSVDHLAEYGGKTRALLEAQGLSEYATVHVSPLIPIEIQGRTYNWYDLESLPKGILIDLLLVDGPPAGTTEHNRYPALPQLADRLADGAFVYLDDTIRTDEKQVIQYWLSEFPALRQETPLPKSTVFRWNTSQS